MIDCNSTRRNLTAGQRAMCTALVMEARGWRVDGKWTYGSVAKTQRSESGTSASQWKQRLAEAGVILDFKPDLAESVINGSLALDAAFRQADSIRTSAERDKIMERERKRGRRRPSERPELPDPHHDPQTGPKGAEIGAQQASRVNPGYPLPWPARDSAIFQVSARGVPLVGHDERGLLLVQEGDALILDPSSSLKGSRLKRDPSEVFQVGLIVPDELEDGAVLHARACLGDLAFEMRDRQTPQGHFDYCR